jgi:hypothetical protein
MTKEKESQLIKLINNFKQKFVELTNDIPSIKFSKKVAYTKLKLEDLESMINTLIPTSLTRDYPEVKSITARLRRRELIDLRAIFCYHANLNEYNHGEIAAYLKFDRTNIYNALKMYDKLISYDDVFIANNEKVKKMIKKSYINGN